MSKPRPSKSPARRLIYADSVSPTQVSWLWPGWLPWGKLAIWEGDPDVGKSLVTVDVAARATRGDLMPDGTPGEAAAVLMLCAEDDHADTVTPRLIAAGAQLDRVAYAELSRRRDASDLITLPSGLAELRFAIRRLRRKTGVARVIVIIDPIVAFLDGDVDANKDADVRRLTTVLGKATADLACSTILIRHLNKAVEVKSAKHRGGGSIGWTAAARSVAIFGNHPRDADLRVMASTKSNLSARPKSLTYRLVVDDGSTDPRVEWGEAIDLRADDLLRTDARTQAPQLETATAVLSELFGRQKGSVTAAQATAAAASAGISQATLKRAAEGLGVVRKKRRAKSGRDEWIWELPPGRKGTS